VKTEIGRLAEATSITVPTGTAVDLRGEPPGEITRFYLDSVPSLIRAGDHMVRWLRAYGESQYGIPPQTVENLVRSFEAARKRVTGL
jgi:hypothetical protein